MSNGQRLLPIARLRPLRIHSPKAMAKRNTRRRHAGSLEALRVTRPEAVASSGVTSWVQSYRGSWRDIAALLSRRERPSTFRRKGTEMFRQLVLDHGLKPKRSRKNLPQ